jgi:hypothetical protein
MRDENDEFFGAEEEPVAKVSWWPTVRWILGMILLFNIVMALVLWFAASSGWVQVPEW